jgi:2'-5' RNA ligase
VRLFVAMDLDDDAREAVAALQRRVVAALGPGRSFKPVEPANMHLTLVFLGEVTEAVAASLVRTLASNIDQRPFGAEFRGLGVFPPRGAPRVVWLGVAKGAHEIVQAQLELTRRVEAAGITCEGRPFHPHLTVGRWRDSRPADRDRAIAVDSPALVARTFVDHVTIYQSRLTQSGPVYTALTRANLT